MTGNFPKFNKFNKNFCMNFSMHLYKIFINSLQIYSPILFSVLMCVKPHAVPRQKMRFADRWSLKHIYNEPSHVGLWLTWSKPHQLLSATSWPGFRTKRPERQAIKSMPKLIYLWHSLATKI